MRMIATVAFSTTVLFSPLFAAAQDAPASAPATAAPAPAATTAAPAPAAAPVATVAATPAPAATAVADSSAVNLNEIVCRSVPAPTGTRLGGGRECHSVREWNDIERQSQDLTRQQQTIGYATKGK